MARRQPRRHVALVTTGLAAAALLAGPAGSWALDVTGVTSDGSTSQLTTTTDTVVTTVDSASTTVTNVETTVQSTVQDAVTTTQTTAGQAENTAGALTAAPKQTAATPAKAPAQPRHRTQRRAALAPRAPRATTIARAAAPVLSRALDHASAAPTRAASQQLAATTATAAGEATTATATASGDSGLLGLAVPLCDLIPGGDLGALLAFLCHTTGQDSGPLGWLAPATLQQPGQGVLGERTTGGHNGRTARAAGLRTPSATSGVPEAVPIVWAGYGHPWFGRAAWWRAHRGHFAIGAGHAGGHAAAPVRVESRTTRAAHKRGHGLSFPFPVDSVGTGLLIALLIGAWMVLVAAGVKRMTRRLLPRYR